MSRRFNFTGRRKLMRSDVHIRVNEAVAGRPQSFVADLKIPSELKLDPQARVYVEAYIGSSAMRFDFGTVSAPSSPAACTLTEIDEGAPVLFRVRVVDEARNVGRVLASLNGIRPEGENDGKYRSSLLPLRSCDLGEEIWRLEFDADAGFELAVNNRIPDVIERFKTDLVFAGLIYPEVVRQIASRILEVDSGAPDDVMWLGDWKKWMEGLLGRPVSSDGGEDMSEDMVADIVSRFADRHQYASIMADARGDQLI